MKIEHVSDIQIMAPIALLKDISSEEEIRALDRKLLEYYS